MSIKQIQKVFTDTRLKGNEKLLMLAIADNANDSGVAFPSWNSLMTKTSMSKGSVSKWLRELENKGLIFRVSRNRKNGSRTSNKYLIYPYDNKMLLDEEELDIFIEHFNQSSEVELVQDLNMPSSTFELGNRGQSSEVEHLKPSLNFNRKNKPSLKEKKEKDFQKFWQAYPRKIAKAKAKTAFMRLYKEMPNIEELLSILERHKASKQWKQSDGKYIPHATTWLNQQRWEDEVEEEVELDLTQFGFGTEDAKLLQNGTG